MAAPSQPIVVDTNILFSALLGGESKFGELLLRGDRSFYVCESVLVELFKRKEKIIQYSRLSSDDLLRAYHILLRHLNLYKEAMIPAECWQQAYLLCADIDPTDTPHVALTLAVQGKLWTGDRRLSAGLKDKGFDDFYSP